MNFTGQAPRVRDRASEKRKVGSSTLPLTTTSQHSTSPLTCAEAVGDRQRPKSQIDRWCPSVAVIRRSLVHAGCTKLDHQLGRLRLHLAGPVLTQVIASALIP